jgi:hypothetical protein
MRHFQPRLIAPPSTAVGTRVSTWDSGLQYKGSTVQGYIRAAYAGSGAAAVEDRARGRSVQLQQEYGTIVSCGTVGPAADFWQSVCYIYGDGAAVGGAMHSGRCLECIAVDQ